MVSTLGSVPALGPEPARPSWRCVAVDRFPRTRPNGTGPKWRLSVLCISLSPTRKIHSGSTVAARFSTVRAGWRGSPAATMSPGRNRLVRQTTRRSPGWSVGTMLSPDTLSAPTGSRPSGRQGGYRDSRRHGGSHRHGDSDGPLCPIIVHGAITCGLSVSHRTYLYHNRPRTKGAPL